MWERFWTDFSKAMLMTDPLAYGLYVAWCLEDRGQEELKVAPQLGQAREPFGPPPARIHVPSQAAGQ